MRKTALLLAIAGAAATSAGAENRVGLLGGLNLVTEQIRPSSDGIKTDTRRTGGGAVVLAFDLGGPFSLRLEPTISHKGTTITIAADDFLFPEQVIGDLRLTYAELPVLLQASAGRGRLRPYLLAGLSPGQLLDAKAQQRGEAGIEDVEEDFQKGDLDALFGGGVAIAYDRTRLFVEGRYALGLVNVAKETEADESLKNRGWQLRVGASWRLGR